MPAGVAEVTLYVAAATAVLGYMGHLLPFFGRKSKKFLTVEDHERRCSIVKEQVDPLLGEIRVIKKQLVWLKTVAVLTSGDDVVKRADEIAGIDRAGR